MDPRLHEALSLVLTRRGLTLVAMLLFNGSIPEWVDSVIGLIAGAL